MERANILSSISTSIISLYTAGLMTKRQALEELKDMGKAVGAFTKIELEETDVTEEEH